MTVRGKERKGLEMTGALCQVRSWLFAEEVVSKECNAERKAALDLLTGCYKSDRYSGL